MKSPDRYEELSAGISEFCTERDWEKYHTPKNLSMALAVEAAELMEIFQWLTPEESDKANLSPARKERVKEEIADIFIYTIRMAQVLDIDLFETATEKLEKNAAKYPLR
ncbi:MAG: nucleotide pyrophosphohydrolase [Candidatus Zixiibacteriota bacterium]|nr:MAG: nucleotide pyrophosphohydrolase [candidate division Zixibacteria bacterium]